MITVLAGLAVTLAVLSGCTILLAAGCLLAVAGERGQRWARERRCGLNAHQPETGLPSCGCEVIRLDGEAMVIWCDRHEDALRAELERMFRS